MNVSLLLEMASAADPERTAVVSGDRRLSIADLDRLASAGGAWIGDSGARSVVYLGEGGIMLPCLIFAAARAGVPFCPLNYRLSSGALRELVGRLDAPLVVADVDYRDAVAGVDCAAVTSDEFLSAAHAVAAGDGVDLQPPGAPDDTAVILFTSGTTSRPKAVELSHANLTSYVMGTVEFDSAAPEDATLICVPPYHVAGVSAVLSNLYAGRRSVYLTRFDPEAWVELVITESITNATVVPTMLDRIITVLERTPTELPSLRTLAYGGAKVGLPLVRRTMELLPGTGLVNAYGLTETSSTIAVLGPDDHREAFGATDLDVRRRLGSVGRPVPGIELEIRDADGEILAPGETGELFIRGPQVSGSYAEIGSVLDDEGWFATKDVASLDAAGYLYIGGRSDDTIIRGGENIAPAEIEDVLIEHPQVRAVSVIGVANDEWGQEIVAVVVVDDGAPRDGDALRGFVRERLRKSRTPDRVVFRNELPVTSTGKILRRALVDELSPVSAT